MVCSQAPSARAAHAGAPRRTWLVGALAVAICLLGAGCGDEEGSGGAGSGGAPAAGGPLPFEGRDTKPARAAFPADDRGVLEAPDRLTLHALHPHPLVDGKLSPQEERLHMWGILGQARIEEADERRRLVEAVYRGLAGEGAGATDCFHPRYALVAEKGDRRIDVVISFECTWVRIYGGAGSSGANRLLFSQSVQPVFDESLERHGLVPHGD